MAKPPDKAIGIAVDYKSEVSEGISMEESLEELAELARTAGVTLCKSFTQHRNQRSRSSYIGQGKIEEIKAFLEEHQINCVITDDELTPAQSKNLERDLNVQIIDRTGLILDIFAQRAKTYEAKLQVELAQLQYLSPRLTRLWTHLSRLGGGIGTKGPGETQLEVDKRQISKRVSLIKDKLKKVQKNRELRRKNRQLLPLLSGALVGYTNAGKSTLMNRLTDAHVLAEDKLFATLDPTSRHCHLTGNDTLILTDTVGFIQKLPTHLVKAFYSTLEEVTEADFLLHVVDASHPCLLDNIKTSSQIIESLNASQKPVLYIFNKWDKVTKPNTVGALIKEIQPQCRFSAKYDPDFSVFSDSLTDLLAPFKKTLSFFIPYKRMDIVNLLHKYGDVLDVQYETDISIKVSINEIIAEKIMASLYD